MSGADVPSASGTQTPLERDILAELPPSSAIASAAIGEHFHHHHHPQSPVRAARSEDEASADVKKKRRRRDSSASRVAVDYFDPEGVHELKRTLTMQSQAAREAAEHRMGAHVSDESTVVSENLALDVEKFDLEQFFKEIVQKGLENNLKPRELGVVFQDLRVQGLGSAASFQPTVGSTLNPLSIPEKIRAMLHPPVRDILSGFEGVVNPGEMLLVLGRPGAGCSTFLKTVSNQHEEFHSVSGLLHFSSFTSKQIRKHFRGDVIYCPEDDIHFPTLTVEQTLNFAARMRMPSKKARIGETSRKQYADEVVDTLTTIFGLRHAKKTKVGNAAIRGVSGGERKRVSIAEALATRSRLGSWDNSTRGLDASTALEFVRALRIATDNIGLTTIVSIYQASELLYELFDKVCVIYEGRMAFFGPASTARQYFIEQGWEPANRQTTADFLVAVTDPIGRTPRQGYENRVPRTADEMAAAFQRHALAGDNKQEIAEFLAQNVIMDLGTDEYDHLTGKLPQVPSVPQEEKEFKRKSYIDSAHAERGKHARPESPYTITVVSQIFQVVIRRVQILQGDWSAQVVTIASFVFQAIITGTLFLNFPNATSAYFSRGGVLFFAILFGALSSMAEIPALYSQRPIVHRHAKAAMYHPFTESMALTLVDIPISLITLILFGVILYFLTNLQRSAGQFFIFYLFIVAVSLCMKAFFRSVAAAFRREAGAQSLAGVMTLALVLYAGYAITKPTMVGALKWITYINPLFYGFEAILTNEFHTLNGTCSQLVPSGEGYGNVSLSNQVCTTVGSLAGQANVDGNRFTELSYGYEYSHLWRNFGIIVAFIIAFLVVLMVLTEFNTASAMETAVVLYKRDSREQEPTEAKGADEEKGQIQENVLSKGKESPEQSERALEDAPSMSDVFSWQNIRYTVPLGKGETRLLLDDVSGYVVPGKLTALMGESGAGKTTLLNVLAGRTDTGVISGDRFVNGQALPFDFQAQTGYCQQLDTHTPEMTVREALLFSAKLRQPSNVPLSEKEAYVDTCLKMCGLEHHADAIVGTLDVEHKKRTTIGVELAAKPRLLLFLDEPTSGLDSQSAWAIMSFVRNLADHGQAILCTIHQPSSELFQVFDRLLLLRKGGQTVYFGDLGPNCSTLINYFERNGARKCEEKENPAEWMLDVIGAGATATSTIDWHNAWDKSEEAADFKVHLDDIHEEGRKRPPVQALQHSEFATSWAYQLWQLTVRGNTCYWRNPTYIIAKLVLNIAGGLFIGFTFFRADNTVQGTQNKLFAAFMSIILTAAHVNQLQIPFIDTRSVYEVRERPSRMYSWTALVTSLMLVEIPWNIFGSLLFFLCWYWTVGFANSRVGYTFLMIVVAFPLYYSTVGQAVAAMSPSAVIGSVLFSCIFSFVIAFCGVVQPFAQMNWWKWMYRLSPFTYLIEGLIGQALGKFEVNCSSTEFVTVEPPSGQTCAQYMDPYISNHGGYLQNPDASSSCNFCAYATTDEFLESSFNIMYSHRWRNIAFMVVYIVFNVAAIYAFTYLFRIRSRR
ncbi:SNQ2_5 [Sanghuangporus sanghuang]